MPTVYRPAYKMGRMGTVGQRVKHARIQAGLSQGKLAKLAGIKQPTISELEKGDSKTSRHLYKIASVTGFNVLWLAEGKGPPVSPGTDALKSFAEFPAHIQKRLITIGKALDDEDKEDVA